MQAPVLSIRNGRRSVVITGTPEQLRPASSCTAARSPRRKKPSVRTSCAAARCSVRFHRLLVEVGFHTPRLADGIAWSSWAATVRPRPRNGTRMSEAIFVAPSTGLASRGAARGRREVDRRSGPRDTATRLTAPVIRGSGDWHRPRRDPAGQRSLFTAGADAQVPPAVVELRPDAVKLPDGSVKLSTKFTRLTGRSPILLAGMTPTTVDAKIVAAAANAGHWAELAGGGQVTEEIFDDRVAELTALLEPGRPVQFNSLFLDPYLWKLQFGGKRLVQRARQSGAPIDGVVVTAGIPDLEDAVDLIEELNSVGISHVVFKPGTIEPDQVCHQDRGRGARQARDRPCRGRPRRWAPLLGGPRRPPAEHLRRFTPAARTSRSASAVASAPPSGRPSSFPAFGRPATASRVMPVDGILVGTAAMATLEATTSPSVKQLFVDIKGTDHWVPAGKAQGGMASSRSQLGADIHEIDNTASRCGRLLDEVAGDAEAAEARRDELIAAMANTAKPYFGDVGDMTYLQWLKRYVELTIGAGDSTADTAAPGSLWIADTWRDRFAEMLKRAEARLHEQDSGPIDTLFAAPDGALLENPETAIAHAARPLSRSRDGSSCIPPTCRSSSRCARRWASRSTLCPSSTRMSGAGGAATRCGRPTTLATTPTRCASSPAPRRWQVSRVSMSRSVSCWTVSKATGLHRRGAPGIRRRADAVRLPAPGPRRRDRTALRRPRLARRALGGPHRDQPGTPDRVPRRVAGQ